MSQVQSGAAGRLSGGATEEVDKATASSIREMVERLRRRLLDLSARNPLISSRLSARFSAFVRVIDEIPDQLRERIFDEEKKMRFTPLPAPGREGKRLLDGQNLEDLDEGALQNYARNCEIQPDYDLPRPGEGSAAPKHEDNEIQTLFPPKKLERKLEALQRKHREHEQETGINVLHAAFGFLEWQDEGDRGKKLLSPLVLAPVQFEVKRTTKGRRFSVQSAGEGPETNTALRELLGERDVSLPLYREEASDETLEAYWERVLEATKKKGLECTVRRQVAFGVFPSARMAMWLDLDTESERFAATPLMRDLLVGGAANGQVSSGEPPPVFIDADATQSEVLADVAAGRNLAVEGPPGTGKSQTIVNAIAVALATGKKVLFISEKAAALEVVEKRLREIGLGDFLLSLHSTRASRPQVVASLRRRINLPTPPENREALERARREQAEALERTRLYADLLASEFRKTGISVHDLLWRAVATREDWEKIPDEVRDEASHPGGQDGAHLSILRGLGEEAALSWKRARGSESFWEGAAPEERGLLGGEEIRRLAREAAKAHEALARARGTATGIAGLVRRFLSRREASEALSALAALAEKAGMPIARLERGGAPSETAALLHGAAKDKEGLRLHSEWSEARARLEEAGVDRAAEALLERGWEGDALGRALESLAVHALVRCLNEEHGGILADFPGSKLSDLRRISAEQDRDIIRLSREWLRAKLLREAKPPKGVPSATASKKTEMGLLWHETSKKRAHVSVRELTRRAGRALLEIKPCWMMSPLTVAHYIERGSIEFDLIIVDEASQMPPEDILGALMRGKRIVVTGDTKQLPPTGFFKKFEASVEGEEEEALQESVLDMANAAFRPHRMLGWHYRSRHSPLIAFSNRTMYGNDLTVFPSPSESNFSAIVAFQKVEGTYEGSTNEAEAKTMMDAALKFMEEEMLRPEGERRSLGIVVMNQPQRDLMEDLWFSGRDSNGVADKYARFWEDIDGEKNRGGLEPFFIKNLENVQGDERDVIFIGITYGPGPEGKLSQNFGPINKDAGPRRLNVLLSRAKEKIVTFSSLEAKDIVVKEDTKRGRRMLRDWLTYAATGHLPASDSPEGRPLITGKPPDSKFEIEVIRRIEAMGFEAVPQVGSAGYFIDIGARHSRWPRGFLLAVECDGAQWHSSRFARERDRLRQEVLEARGWVFHRVWSTDWFADPGAETERLRVRLEARLEELLRGEGGAAPGGGGPDGAEGEPGEAEGEPGGDDGGA